MPILDTNFLIALDSGVPEAHALLDDLADEALLVPSIVAAEYLTHFPEPRSVQGKLDNAFQVVHTDGPWIHEAALLRRAHRGTSRIRRMDLWIAVWAKQHGTFVVTQDTEDFRALGVRTRSW